MIQTQKDLNEVLEYFSVVKNNCQNIKFTPLNQSCSAYYTVGLFGLSIFLWHDFVQAWRGFFFFFHISSKCSLVKLDIYEHDKSLTYVRLKIQIVFDS